MTASAVQGAKPLSSPENPFATNAHAAHLFDGTALIRQIVRPRADPHDTKFRDNSLLGKLLHFAQQFFLHRSSHFGTFHDDTHLITASIFLCLSCQPSLFLPSTRRSRSGRRTRRTEPSANTYDKHTLRNAKKNLPHHGQIHCSQRSVQVQTTRHKRTNSVISAVPPNT